LRCAKKTVAQKDDKKKLAQRRRGAKEERAWLDVPSALLFSLSYPCLLILFLSSLLCAFASLREISFSCVVCATWHLMDIMRRPHGIGIGIGIGIEMLL
jgi:hypothetical protein